MDQPFGLIRQIQRSKRFMLKVRAIRIFEKSFDSNYRRQLEIVFHDEEGTRISGIIRGVHLSKMAGYFHECGIYKIRNYYLDSNIDKYRSTAAKYKLLIHTDTEVLEIHAYFPSWHFQFRSFADFQDVENVDESYLFDVIGMVIEIHPVQSKWVHGQKSQMIVFSLMDLNGIVIKSTLWGHYVDQLIAFETHFESEATGEPWVLIMQLCRARFWEASPWAKKSKYVTNSKIVLKSEMEELENGDLVVSSIDSLFDSDEEVKCWVCAAIDSIVDEWWYLACNRCKGKDVSNLVGKTILFKVRVYPKNPLGYAASFPVGSDFLTILQREDHDNGLDATLDDEVSTPIKVFQPIEKGDTSTAKRKLLNDLSSTPNVDQSGGSANADTEKGKIEKLDPSGVQFEDVAEN
ncbi:replication protein A 70 kDa DNA-binding subunit [Striga asiatica]|uniref:Replication protein A 70 kDa DNA-binding subunit n=1 Tax=Striga asiatica TaxID=4170 RepID=A0A5A7PHL0_STRAF|nr:replication protein A 70 kDa DNA-binding subunit [Striga asiatica]